MQELAAVGFANLSDFVTWDQAGVYFKESANIPKELMPALKEVTEHLSLNGRTMKIKLHDKIKALGLLADILGLRDEMAPKIEIQIITGVPRLSYPPAKALPPSNAVVDVEKMDGL